MDQRQNLIRQIEKALGYPDLAPILGFYQKPDNNELFSCAERPGEWLTEKECLKITARMHFFYVRASSELAKKAVNNNKE
jgi:hypothetical protein